MNTDYLNKTLQRREKMARVIEQSLKEAPKETSEILNTIAKIYYSGSITYFWDFLAALSGNDRGFGNDWFFTACELMKQKKGMRDG